MYSGSYALFFVSYFVGMVGQYGVRVRRIFVDLERVFYFGIVPV